VIESLAISKLMSRKALPLSGSDLALAGTSYFPSARPSEIAANAGSAGVGHRGIESKQPDRIIMACEGRISIGKSGPNRALCEPG
jgi:hypothetical protein